MSLLRFVFRLWYYFRIGYGTYLVFLVGAFGHATVVYYLLINNVALLKAALPHFTIFLVLAAAIVLPLATFIGWLHMKRTPAWASEVDIGVEANPYYYRLAPGHQSEVFAPLNLELLRQVKKLLQAQNLIGEEDRRRIEELEAKLEHLIKGGYVGTPRQHYLRRAEAFGRS